MGDPLLLIMSINEALGKARPWKPGQEIEINVTYFHSFWSRCVLGADGYNGGHPAVGRDVVCWMFRTLRDM